MVTIVAPISFIECEPAIPAPTATICSSQCVWSYIQHHSPYFADLVRQASMVHVFQSPEFCGTCFVPFYTAKLNIKRLEPEAARDLVERAYTTLRVLPSLCGLERVPMKRGVLDVTCLRVLRSQQLVNGAVYVVEERSK